MSTPAMKRAIPVPVEKALKGSLSYLLAAKEDLVCRSTTFSDNADDDVSRNIQLKILDQLKSLGDTLTNHLDLALSEHKPEKELAELIQSAHDDIDSDFTATYAAWVDTLLKKITSLLASTQHVNLERLTEIMEKNEEAGDGMEGKEVVLLLGSAGSGKTSTLHYLAGTVFQEVTVAEDDTIQHYEPVDIIHPEAEEMKICYAGAKQGTVVTRHLQVAELDIDGRPVVICDTPSFGYHESVEEVIGNSLGLVRALQKAKTVRPVFVLNHNEMATDDRFLGYPQLLTILNRLLGDTVVAGIDMEPFMCIFTKYDSDNAEKVEEQLSRFQMEILNDNSNSSKHAVIQYLIEHGSDLGERVLKPTTGDPMVFLKNLLQEDPISSPGTYFKPKISNIVTSTLKRQLKFTLLNLRSSLVHDDNSTAIFRMGQLSDLANVLPEAGIYARHGFKAFKEIISKMVEEDIDEEYTADSELCSSSSGESEESWTSTESEQWHNLSSKLPRLNSFAPPHHLTTVSEEGDDGEEESKEEGDDGEEESKEDPPDENMSAEEVTKMLDSLEESSEDDHADDEAPVKKEEKEYKELPQVLSSGDSSASRSRGEPSGRLLQAFSKQYHRLSPTFSKDSSHISTKVGKQLHLGLPVDCSGISSLSSSSSDESSENSQYDSVSEDGAQSNTQADDTESSSASAISTDISESSRHSNTAGIVSSGSPHSTTKSTGSHNSRKSDQSHYSTTKSPGSHNSRKSDHSHHSTTKSPGSHNSQKSDQSHHSTTSSAERYMLHESPTEVASPHSRYCVEDSPNHHISMSPQKDVLSPESGRSTAPTDVSESPCSRRSEKSDNRQNALPEEGEEYASESPCSRGSEKSDNHQNPLPEEDEEYAENYITLLREMIMDAVNQQDDRMVLRKMQAFCEAVRNRPQEAQEHQRFQQCVELFMRYSVALQERNYPKCLSAMKKMRKLQKEDFPEADKCSQLGLDAAVRHIVDLRESVVNITHHVHEIVDPDEFDRVLEVLRVEREKVEQSNSLIEMCMKESNDKGKSETMLACISYGFKLGRTTR